MTDDPVDRLLTRHYADRAPDDTAASRVMSKLNGPLPSQKRATAWPQFLLDWQFAPAWPRVVAFAGCAALGFIVGTAGIDRIGGLSASSAGNDFASAIFEPETLTGARP